MSSTDTLWRKCSNCKTPISLGTKYWVCNVSTCNRKRTGLVFCSVDCWDAHLPIARHRDAWAEERWAPKSLQAEDSGPKRLEMRPKKSSSSPARSPSAPSSSGGGSLRLDPPPPDETLVVASKVKDYIRARSGMNTSASVLKALSDRVRIMCDEAMKTAAKDERKTVMDRDF